MSKKPGTKKSEKKSSSPVLKILRRHSLSIVLALLTIAMKVTAALMPEGYWQDFFNGFGDDTWGAFVIVVATKYFMEKGSPESRDEK